MLDDARERFAELKASGLLPSPKGVALAVLELTQRSDASIQALTRLVQSDPAMAGRLLRYANAAHGGSLRHIASLPHAIVFLGLFRVRQIALGFSLIDHYRSGSCAGFDYLGYWTASLAAGIAAQQVAHRAQCPPDESFTCGLLAGIGRLALATVFPEEYGAILASGPDSTALRMAEAAAFGLDHCDLSAELLQDWGLPELFHSAVRYHETPAEAPFAAGSRAQALTAALHLAGKVGQLLNIDEAQRWQRVPSLYQAAAQLGLEDHELPPLVETVAEQWRDWGLELRLPIPEFQDLQTLMAMSPAPAPEGGAAALMVLPMRVALAVRSPALLRPLADTLEAMGLRVDLASERDAALRLLHDTQPDVLLLELPGASDDAVQWLRALRATGGGRHAHCIALIPAAAEAEVARLMLAGASDYLLHDYSEAALLARLNTAQRVVALQGAVRAERASTIKSSGEWARSNRRLLHAALTDALTQLPNRRYGLDRLAQEWSLAGHYASPLSCMMLDIDHFKRINDQHGHDIGDRVLAQLARVVEASCRKNDVVFRFGGEEFCVLCPHTSPADALALGERIAAAVRGQRYGESGRGFAVTISIGVASSGASLATAEDLIARADKALYAAKSAGRDRVMVAP